jgi:DNA-binding NarL/FixJ family response regulator
MNIRPVRRIQLLVEHTDPIVAAGLVAALREQPAFDVLVHGAEPLVSPEVAVDVVIADYANALRLADRNVRFGQGLPDGAKILVVTNNDREADIRRAIEAGVYGYILVGGSLRELVDGVTAVANGLRYMSPPVAHRMADSLTRAVLTSREVEVLRLVASGRSNKIIARDLAIELGTVKSHVSAIMAKLGASSRTQAAGIAASRGLVDEIGMELQPMPASARAPEMRMQLNWAG